PDPRRLGRGRLPRRGLHARYLPSRAAPGDPAGARAGALSRTKPILLPWPTFLFPKWKPAAQRTRPSDQPRPAEGIKSVQALLAAGPELPPQVGARSQGQARDIRNGGPPPGNNAGAARARRSAGLGPRAPKPVRA